MIIQVSVYLPDPDLTPINSVPFEHVTGIKALCLLFSEQLKHNREVNAEHYDSVTVYFSDIMDFTAICGACSPHQIIDLLNKLYR